MPLFLRYWLLVKDGGFIISFPLIYGGKITLCLIFPKMFTSRKRII